jgi:D-aminoacyl-tRNA deacylase
MIGIIYSKLDEAGVNMAEHLVKSKEFESSEGPGQIKYQNDISRIYEVDSPLFNAEIVDSFGCETLVFLSRHKSEAGVSAFTTHSLGNWRNEAAFGGVPKQLSCAAPVMMLGALANLSKIDAQAQKVYEATHHGPLTKTPAVFIELGGNEEMIQNKANAARVADAAYNAISSFAENRVDFQKIVVGIGSNHYPEKFSRIALEKGYAFSHIMPKYAIINQDGTNNLDVLEQTLTKSQKRPEAAVLDWKSLNSAMKEETVKKLEEIGLDYEKV